MHEESLFPARVGHKENRRGNYDEQNRNVRSNFYEKQRLSDEPGRNGKDPRRDPGLVPQYSRGIHSHKHQALRRSAEAGTADSQDIGGKKMDSRTKALIKAASLVCRAEDCICGHECGCSKEGHSLPMIGEETTCPLERYGMPEKAYRPKDFMDGFRHRPAAKDLRKLCSVCEHRTEEDYVGFCLDCPVQMVWEAISETEAEAAIS